MAVLYRKYRPKLWSEVYGQDSIKNVLLSEIKQNKIANCYIFSGPRGVGKTTVARLMAKSLNCLDRKENGEPCLACKNCLEFSDSASSNMNIIELDAASNRGVDDTSEFLENVNIPAIGASYKVFIIDEVHMFSKHSFNRLLKTFEEPPKGVVFILATTEFNKIPDTIISRAEVFKFKKGDKDSLLFDLKAICLSEKVSVSDDVLEAIISKSSGCFRDAETLLGQVVSSGSSDIKISDVSWLNSGLDNLIFDFTGGLVKKDLKYLISFISNLSSLNVSYSDFIYELIEFLRKIMIYSVDSSVCEEWSLSDLHISKISGFSKDFSVNFLVKIIDEFIECKLRMNVFEIKNLALELSVMKLCGNDEIMQKHDDKNNNDSQNVPDKNSVGANIVRPDKTVPLKNNNNIVYEKIEDVEIDDEIDEIKIENDENNVGANSVRPDDENDEFDLDIPDFLDDDENIGIHGASVKENDDLLDKFKVKKSKDGKIHSEYTERDGYIDESKMGDENKSVLDMMKEIL